MKVSKNNTGSELKRVELLKPFVSYASKRKQVFLDSAKKYGTPQYFLDEELLISNVNLLQSEFKKTIPNSKIFYAFKSNDLPYMISLLKKQGINADVSCMFEMQLACKLGFDKIIYSAPYKSKEEILFAIENNVILNVDNSSELQKIIDVSSKCKNVAKVSFRITINPDWKKFGICFEELKQLITIVEKNKKLSWIGIHSHSSWNNTPDSYANTIKTISLYLKNNFTLDRLSKLKFIDIGGGFMPFESVSIEDNVDIPASINEFARVIGNSVTLNINKNLGITPEIWFEPGRMISSIPTTILLTVDSIKSNTSNFVSSNLNSNEYIVDGGINLIGYALFEHEYYPVANITQCSLKLNNEKINGPLCDPSDHWGSWYFGEKLQKGDVVAVMNQGAYTFATTWRWQRPICKYIAFSKGKFKIVKSEETFEQRFSGCKF
jgi:diaminopimelate decarboxylase